MNRALPLRCAAAAMLVAATGLAGARAQDERDVVTLKQGPPLRGRVFARYEPDFVTVQVGKEKKQVPFADVVAMDTVRDRVREFFALLDRLPDNLKHRWFLAGWAADRELHDLARLTALDVVLRDPDHADAHAMLGHRLVRGQWQWPCDGEWKTFAELEAVRADWQHGWQIEGEHFRVYSNVDLRRVVDAVWDLERFHVAWFDRFGQGMRLYEVVDPKVHVEIWSDERRFPGMRTVPGKTTGKNPYYEWYGGKGATPAVSRTYFADENAPRPARLFEMATFHLLYCTVADNANLASAYRPGAWGELGLARYLEHRMTGPAGRAVLGPFRIDADEARLVLKQSERDLGHVTQRDSKKLWGGVSDDNEYAWPAVELAVAFLLESGQTGLRDGFLRYMVDVRRPVKGDSTTALDRNLGQKIEALDEPWRAWIKKQLEPPKPTTPTTRPN